MGGPNANRMLPTADERLVTEQPGSNLKQGPERAETLCDGLLSQMSRGDSAKALSPSLVSYWSPARTDVMRCVLKPSQCIRPR
jgi:hypothetical protein